MVVARSGPQVLRVTSLEEAASFVSAPLGLHCEEASPGEYLPSLSCFPFPPVNSATDPTDTSKCAPLQIASCCRRPSVAVTRAAAEEEIPWVRAGLPFS